MPANLSAVLATETGSNPSFAVNENRLFVQAVFWYFKKMIKAILFDIGDVLLKSKLRNTLINNIIK
jgi:hypothetical protein